jgi:YbbR-like protein.
MTGRGVYKRFGLKIFSLLTAVAVWFYIHGVVQQDIGGPPAYKDIKNIEIRLMGEQVLLGKNVFKVDLERNTVDVRVKGPEKEIEKITSADVIAYVDISGLKSGRTYSPVVNFILPPAIEIVGAPRLVRVDIKETSL